MPAMPEMLMAGHDMKGHYTPLYKFIWPVDGWVRGFDVELYDSTGQKLNRRLLHHITLLNFDRRQLISPYVERLFAFGNETKSVMVPKTVGVPMSNGFHMGMYMAWNNTTEHDMAGTYLHVRLYWMPKNMNPQPTSVLPVALEVRKGESGPYTAPPGVSTKSFEFTLPGGRANRGSRRAHARLREFLELVDLETGKDGAAPGFEPGFNWKDPRSRTHASRHLRARNPPQGQSPLPGLGAVQQPDRSGLGPGRDGSGGGRLRAG
jgi:hypothetical protein